MLMNDPDLGNKPTIKQPSNGFRRLSPAMLATDRIAKNFTGLSDGEESPGTVLAAFKAAAPYLSLSHRTVHAVDWLFRFTQKQDWEPGSHPVVWPSASMQTESLGLSLSQVKALNRQLVELGLVVMRDSANGKRYGRRNKYGRIIEAYGFDLSPLGARMAEFRAVAEQGRETRETIRRLRRRASIANVALLKIFATAIEYGVLDSVWQSQATETQKLARRLAKTDRLDALFSGVGHLESQLQDARERLEARLLPVENSINSSFFAVDTSPKGPESKPHNTTTNQDLSFYIKTTVMALRENGKTSTAGLKPTNSGGSSKGIAPAKLDNLRDESASRFDIWRVPESLGLNKSPHKTKMNQGKAAKSNIGLLMRITPSELIELTPRLKPYLATSSPLWGEIVEAADWLRRDLGVSQSLWGDACQSLGREKAAIAVAIVSARPDGYLRGSPGGYFRGMVKKAHTGDLNLDRTMWRMQQTSQGKK